MTHAPGLRRVATWIAGVEPRKVPLFAGETLQQWRLEPSCTAVFRSDAAELFDDDQDVRRLEPRP